MHNKLAIARKVAKLGTQVVIADGTDAQIMSKLLTDHKVGTRFPAIGDASSAKRWLASADDHATGSVTVNKGAEDALLDSTTWPACYRSESKQSMVISSAVMSSRYSIHPAKSWAVARHGMIARKPPA